MKTIERLKALEAKATGAPWRRSQNTVGSYSAPNQVVCEKATWEDVDLIADVRNALPALLAVVEAQAAEIEAWREVDVAASAVMKIMRIHGGGALVEEMKEVAMQKKDIVRGARVATDKALRAMEGGS